MTDGRQKEKRDAMTATQPEKTDVPSREIVSAQQAEQMTFRRVLCKDRPPSVGSPVLTITESGHFHVAARRESPFKPNTYIWVFMLNGKPAGVLENITAWFEAEKISG